jgi:hypothetical protein
MTGDKINIMKPTKEQKTETVIMNAVIESARLSFDDRGFLDCWLNLDYGGMGQGFGGYVLYIPKSFDHHSIESVAGHFLFRVMEVAGVQSFDALKGRTIRVKREGDWGEAFAVGHIVKDDWFCPRDDFAELNQKAAITKAGAQ